MKTLTKRNLEIDRLRAIAILIVLYAHFCIMFFPQGTVLKLMAGTSMLDLSFTISGFVISSILVSQIDNLKSKAELLVVFIKAFYLRRICRIYPPALVIFVASFIGSFIIGGSLFSTPGNTLAAGGYILTYTFNYYFLDKYHGLALSPYWTLVIEEQFYLLFPLFLILTRNNVQRVWLSVAMLVLITFVIRPVSLYYYKGPAIFFSQVRFDGFFYGYLIYCLMNQSWIGAVKLTSVCGKWMRSIGVSVLFATMIIATLLDASPAVLIPVGMLLGCLLVILAGLNSGIIVFPGFIQDLLDFFGARFYSLYLVHFPAILTIKALVIHFEFLAQYDLFFAIPAVLVTVIIATELLYRLVEVPSKIKGKTISTNIMNQYKKHLEEQAAQKDSVTKIVKLTGDDCANDRK